jgi:hypothetical protein
MRGSLLELTWPCICLVNYSIKLGIILLNIHGTALWLAMRCRHIGVSPRTSWSRGICLIEGSRDESERDNAWEV